MCDSKGLVKKVLYKGGVGFLELVDFQLLFILCFKESSKTLPWVVRVMEWFFSVSVFWAEFTLNSLLSALMSFRASSIQTRGEDCEFLRGRVCEGLSRDSKS